ncbi:PH domain-containing protein [Flavobacterium sp. MXW15]|uniref:PH domain-containing protein n=1 Tax=Xanthomonas chitinilytica TaxID=2989819 RepID=A0ABT3K0C0_9XANT|nr:PH domain-containing protein [Xanthomonas sp. H13-6]MCW4456443.1 PH domain-containing protein [Flavobacterium sp. MXW15]MCW4474177.1 PH domain-containing protein [Xanthomonas sp. H13-6]
MSSLADTGAGQERRLHPWSWLFVLLQQIRQFMVPLLALLIFGSRGDRNDLADHLVTLTVVVVLVAISVLQYLTYRYRIGSDGLSIRSGLLQRNRREIPFARIHNVVVHQNMLHRLFGVAELRLESAGGHKPEAQMRVLKLDQALALERLVRHRGSSQAVDDSAGEPSTEVLLALPTAELVRLGLISNRAMVVLAAAFGAGYQMFPRQVVEDFLQQQGRQVFGYASHLQLGAWTTAITVTTSLLFLLAVMRLLSVGLALLQYHGFRLTEAERRLTVERGLLTRLRTSAARRRIQAWTLREGLLHRLFGRRSLRIDIASGNPQDEHGRALKELAPIATPQACDALVRHLLPHVQWPPEEWRPVARQGWWRLCLPSLWLLLPLTMAACWHLGYWGLLPLLWLPWSAFKAQRQIQRMGWSIDAQRVALRGGWWNRWWRFAELDKLQALQLSRSPLDRRFGTATLTLDTAGAGAGPSLQLRFLPEAEARAVFAQLSQALARRKLRW